MGGLLRLADAGKRSQITKDVSTNFSPVCFVRAALSCRSVLRGPLLSDVRSAFFLDLGLSIARLRRLRRYHLVRLPNQTLQLVPTHSIQPVQHHPLIAPNIRRRTNVLALDQLCESLWCALQAKPRIIQPEQGKDLVTDFETKIVAPLQLLSSVRECQAKFANGVDVRCVLNSESDRTSGNPILQGD
jgi:hypothetical protein